MMRSEVLDFCRREELFSPGEEVICALSGGADSMALLWCLHSLQAELDIHVSAAHFNHCLRGAASEGDEEFVRSFCEAQGIVLHTGRGDAAEHARQTGKSIEEAARELRYDYLLSLPCHKLATAHHADDNGETVTCQSVITGLGYTYNQKSLSQNIICQYVFWQRLENRIDIKQCLINGGGNCE